MTLPNSTPPFWFDHLADQDWNHDWEDGGEHWRYAPFASKVFDRFIRAVAERNSARGVDAVYAPPGDSPPEFNSWTDNTGIGGNYPNAAGDYSFIGGGIALLQTWLQRAYVNYVEKYDTYGTGSAIDYAASPWTPTVLDVDTSNVGWSILTTPWDIDDAHSPQNYFRRKKPREISSFTDHGEEGWIARLLNVTGSGITSPPEIRFGYLYRYVSGAWTLFEPVDPTLYKPDVLDQTNGIAQPGDYFGPWILNDLRDQINRLETVKTNVISAYLADDDYTIRNMYGLGWSVGDELPDNNRSFESGGADNYDHTAGFFPQSQYENSSDGVNYQWTTAFGYMAIRTDGYLEGADNFPDGSTSDGPLMFTLYLPSDTSTWNVGDQIPFVWTDNSVRSIIIDGVSIGSFASGHSVTLPSGPHSVTINSITVNFTVAPSHFEVTFPYGFPDPYHPSTYIPIAWTTADAIHIYVDPTDTLDPTTGTDVGVKTSGQYGRTFTDIYPDPHNYGFTGPDGIVYAPYFYITATATYTFRVWTPSNFNTFYDNLAIVFTWSDTNSYEIFVDGVSVGTHANGAYSQYMVAGPHTVVINSVTEEFDVQQTFSVTFPLDGNTYRTDEYLTLTWTDGNVYDVLIDGVSIGVTASGFVLRTFAVGTHTLEVNGITVTITAAIPTAGTNEGLQFIRPDDHMLDSRTFTAYFILWWDQTGENSDPNFTSDAETTGPGHPDQAYVFDTVIGTNYAHSAVLGDSALGAPPNAASGASQIKGWYGIRSTVLVNWGASGGFQYTKATTGTGD